MEQEMVRGAGQPGCGKMISVDYLYNIIRLCPIIFVCFFSEPF